MTASSPTSPKRVRRQYIQLDSGVKKSIPALPEKSRQIFVIKPNKWQQILVSEEAYLEEMWREKIQKANEVYLKNRGRSQCSGAYGGNLDYSILNSLHYQEITRIRHELAAIKISSIVGHVQNLLDNDLVKLVVMVQREEVVNALRKAFPFAVLFEQGMDASQWQAASTRFQQDQQCRMAIQRIKTTGQNKSLTIATHVLFAEQEWEHQVMSHVENCLIGDRQKESLISQMLVFANSLDEKACQTLSPSNTCFIQQTH
jgi:hypothetical protein